MNLEVKVVPNSKRFSIAINGNEAVIHLECKAEKGRANLELVKTLKKMLKRNVSIVKGLKNRKKVIEIEGTEKEVLESIKNKCSG